MRPTGRSSNVDGRLADPGDHLVGEPSATTSRPVGTEAAPAGVRRWLAPLGQDRVGLHGQDLLDNPPGRHVHPADAVPGDGQHLTVGDRIRLGAARALDLPDGLAPAPAPAPAPATATLPAPAPSAPAAPHGWPPLPWIRSVGSSLARCCSASRCGQRAPVG